MTSELTVAQALPHRAPMLLLDSIGNLSAESVIGHYTPRAGEWYCGESGDMPAWIGIELMAQTVAAHVGWRKRLEGLPPRPGALLGTRSYTSTASEFPCGQALEITASRIYMDESGLGAYECGIRVNGAVCVQAVLKVYEPRDFNEFLNGNGHG